MDSAVQAFKDKMAEKAAAKVKALDALGRATRDGKDEDWAAVAKYGVKGEEGKAFADMQAMADAYVAAHPEKFTAFEQYLTPEGNEQIVQLIAALGKSGMEEAALELTMFELAKFERQTFGTRPAATLRLAGG